MVLSRRTRPSIILSPHHSPLRVHRLLPAIPRLFSSGRAARDGIGWVGRLVQSILVLVFGELPVVGSMPVVGFMPVEVGRVLVLWSKIWRCLGALFLVELLRWSELKMVERNSSVDSFNKAPARGGGFSWRGDFRAVLLPRRRGADTEEKASDVDVVDSGWPRGRSMLLLGDLHAGAMAGHRDLWPSGRPLQTPTMASSQPPIWRPFERSAWWSKRI